MDHISAAQNITIRQITNSPYYFHNTHIYDEIKLLSLLKFLQNLSIKFHSKLDNELLIKLAHYDQTEPSNKKRPKAFHNQNYSLILLFLNVTYLTYDGHLNSR
jgi:hypothetical protein